MSTHKSMLGTFKSEGTAKGVTIEGWANKAVVDRGGDLIPKSAWQLGNFQKNAIILFNHDKNKPIGKAVAVEARDDGLYVKAKISGSADPEISKIRDLIKEGVLNAFSVGFDSLDEAKSADGHNEIRGAELFEISVVSLPMNQDSLFSLAKQYDLDTVKTKALELAPRMFEVEHEAPAAAPEGDESLAEKAQAEDEDAEVAPPDPAQPADSAKAPSEGLELEWQAVMLPKASFADEAAVAAYLEQAQMKPGTMTDQGEAWLVTFDAAESFLALTDLPLPQGVTAKVGVCNPAQDAPEDAAEGEDTGEAPEDAAEAKSASLEAKDMPTAPLAEAPQMDLPEDLLQARQTNILLSQIVAEFQGLRQALLAVAEGQPPKAAPEEVTPEPTVPPEDAAQKAMVAAAHLQIKSILDRIGA